MNEVKIPKHPYELFNIECGKGWEPLYKPIIDYIEEYNKTHKDNPIEIYQIKEKYGSMRFYTNYYTDELANMIDDAEEKSYHTCEVCGKYIEEPIEENYWIYAECKECHDDFKRRRQEAYDKMEKNEKR